MARNLAMQCLEEAKTASVGRAFQLISEYDRHIERAEWYEERAAWYAPHDAMAAVPITYPKIETQVMEAAE